MTKSFISNLKSQIPIGHWTLVIDHLVFAMMLASVSRADWPTYRGNLERSGNIDGIAGPTSPKVLWAHASTDHFLASPVADKDLVYVSALGARTNEVIRVLTVISTIFVPLTFLAGVYGMNFHHFPELAWRWGYLGFWGVSVAVVVVLLAFLRRRGWI